MDNPIEVLFNNARAATGTRTHLPVGATEPTFVETVSRTRSTTIGLGAPRPLLGSYFDAEGHLRRIPAGRSTSFSVEGIDVLAAARAHSRLAAFGAQLLLREPPIAPPGVGVQGLGALSAETSGLSMIRPLKLEIVADGVETPTTNELPVVTALADWSDATTAPSYASYLRLSRADFRQRLLEGTLAEILEAAIVAGLGRVADQAIMRALAAANLGDFSLAAVAAAGVAFGDLRAVVGTAAAGAAVGADGALRAAGVPAELTDTGASTFIGDFRNAGVLFDREVIISAEKTGLGGDLVVSVATSAVGLVPDPAQFWRVVA